MDDLIKDRALLFDEQFKPKVNDVEKIRDFCKRLSDITNIQVCTSNGYLYEYLPQVYNSVVKNKEHEM